MKRFCLNGGTPQSLRDIARDVIRNYAWDNPKMTAHEIRDYFVNACDGVGISHIVETEEEYHTRDGQKSQERTVNEIVTPNGEKLYVSTQWRAGGPRDNFLKFKDIVNRRGWGKIV